MSQYLSTVVISAVGLACKAFLNSGLCSITVHNLPVLLDALRRDRQGLVTVSNHLSTSVDVSFADILELIPLPSLDDPLAWGILPLESFRNSYTTRWVLGASDIMFTNPLFSVFFRNGQVIETYRGSGIWQPALDQAIEKLNYGHWVHMFAEGKVHQPAVYPRTDGVAYLPRFKWGVGRIIMEANVPPLIIPMWLTGFDKLMPEHRPFPYKYFPKMGVQLGITFGDPIPPDKIMVALNALSRLKRSSPPPGVENRIYHNRPPSKLGPSSVSRVKGWMESDILQAGGDRFLALEDAERHAQMDVIRSEITSIIQKVVEDLGRKVSGTTLDLPLPRQGGRE